MAFHKITPGFDTEPSKGRTSAHQYGLFADAPCNIGTGTSTNSGTDSGTDSGTNSRNDPCPCGSGKKFKLCHGKLS